MNTIHALESPIAIPALDSSFKRCVRGATTVRSPADFTIRKRQFLQADEVYKGRTQENPYPPTAPWKPPSGSTVLAPSYTPFG